MRPRGKRKANDAYDTAPEVALACMEWLEKEAFRNHYMIVDPGPRILDPTAGTGPFVKAARSVFPESLIAAVDLRPECEKACKEAGTTTFWAADALSIPGGSLDHIDLIVTNPPFTLADPLARHFYAHMHPGAALAFLLNVTFIGSENRWALPEGNQEEGLFKAAPLTYMVPIQPRPQFLDVNSEGKKASSPLECALFVWVKPDGTETETGRTYFGATIPPEPIRWRKA